MNTKIVQTAGRDQLESFAPDFAHFNDDILFGENWNNTDISLRTRCIITVVALMAQGVTDNSIRYHIRNAKDHSVSRKEMAAIITHTAFYAGWPHAWAVFGIAKEVYGDSTAASDKVFRMRSCSLSGSLIHTANTLWGKAIWHRYPPNRYPYSM